MKLLRSIPSDAATACAAIVLMVCIGWFMAADSATIESSSSQFDTADPSSDVPELLASVRLEDGPADATRTTIDAWADGPETVASGSASSVSLVAMNRNETHVELASLIAQFDPSLAISNVPAGCSLSTTNKVVCGERGVAGGAIVVWEIEFDVAPDLDEGTRMDVSVTPGGSTHDGVTIRHLVIG